MYINSFVAGIMSTISVELVLFFGAVLVAYWRRK